MYQEKQAIYNVAIYLRLSKEDGDNIESESISNQRKIIKEYIDKNNDMKFVNEYVDDGYSGANFNRPSFKRMLNDIENKKINMVITKNLARLGRNYIETGEYIEKYFPDHRVRYIAILDRVDNFEDSVSNEFIPIKSVFNEKHCKDTSISVKKTKRRKMQEGLYCCNTAPFGYKKDPDNPGKLIIDETSSKTVKLMFELKDKGYTYKEITEYLEKNNYKTPAEYMQIRGHEHLKDKNVWRMSSVKRIICNEVYLGNCIRGKTQNISYKSKKRVHIKRTDRIITQNTHEAIIDEEMFYRIHNTKKFGLEKEYTTHSELLRDFIYCKECGKKLIFKKSRNKTYIYCRNNGENIKLCCNDCKLEYSIIEDKIFEYIINMYKEYFQSSKLADNIYKKYGERILKNLDLKLKELEDENSRIRFKINSLYTQRLSSTITEDEYKERYKLLSEKRKEVAEGILKYQEEIKNKQHELKTLNQKRTILKKISKLEKKDFNKVNMSDLISKIEIFKKDIYVYFNFFETGLINL